MALYNQVERLDLDASTIVPIHGQPVAWNEFLNVVGEQDEANS